MNILNIGDIIPLTNITFEDNVYDIKHSHPGIVLIPTSEYDDFAYCVYMTSDKNRFRNDTNKYFPCNGIYKTSYVNLNHIVKIPNMFKVSKNIDQRTFKELLRAVYEYHIENGETHEFEEIRDKIEIILELFKAKKDNKCIEIDDENIKICEEQPREDIPLLMYIKYRNSISRINEYERTATQVIRVKSKLENFFSNDYKKGDITKTKELYRDLKIFNKDNLENVLKYAIILLKVKREYSNSCQDLREDLYEIIQQEKDKERKKEEKRMKKDLNKIESEKEKMMLKELERRRRLEEKYGKFDFDLE